MIRSASFTCVNNPASKARAGSMEASEQYGNNSNSRRSSHHKAGSVRTSPMLYR